MAKYRVVMLRHGESVWNNENRFCGWVNIDLSPAGIQNAVSAANLLKKAGYTFDLGFTSALKRAQKTMQIILSELGLQDIPVVKSWQLNERHYGNLTGMNRVKCVEQYGIEQVKIWRRSFDVAPPPIEESNPHYHEIINDEAYKDGPPKDQFPKTESLKMSFARVIPYWEQNIVPEIQNNKRIILALHGSTCRAIIKHLSKISDEDIKSVNIPNGIPIEYNFNEDMSVAPDGDMKFLGDPEEIKKQMQKEEDKLKKN